MDSIMFLCPGQKSTCDVNGKELKMSIHSGTSLFYSYGGDWVNDSFGVPLKGKAEKKVYVAGLNLRLEINPNSTIAVYLI